MAIGDISLTASMRSILVSLQENSNLMNRTQERLSTGKKVNSALDNPANYFAAKGHTDRANILDGRKDAMGEAIQTIKAADKGIKAITSLIETARGIVSQARSSLGNATAMGALDDQLNEIYNQIDRIVADSGYKGVNLLLDTTSLVVRYNEDGTSSTTLDGFDASTAEAGLDLADQTWNDTTTNTDLDDVETALNAALTTLRTNAAGLASSLNIIQTRVSFTTDMVNTLTEGANKLTAADINEEGANMLMLQTRQQLGTTALSLASQAAQGVLRLF